MASWMIHFRVAEALLDAGILPTTHWWAVEEAFVMGNIAPDSGVPTTDGSHYEPPKAVSHFHVRNERGYKECDLAAFTARHLSPPPDDPLARAFYLGYLAHLYTDNQWVEKIGIPAQHRFPHEYRDGYADAKGRVKTDWYALDCLFLQAHPDFRAYRRYENAPPFVNRYVDFYAEDAFEARKAFILDFYREGVAHAVERETYLSEEELVAFVRETANELTEKLAAIPPIRPIIRDSRDIAAIDEAGIRFRDGTYMTFEACAGPSPTLRCIGERDLFAHPPYIEFYAKGRPVRITFPCHGLADNWGDKNKKAFRDLQKHLQALGYSTYDLG